MNKMKTLACLGWSFFALTVAAPLLVAQSPKSADEDEFAVLLAQLRRENPGESEKVVELARTDRPAALRFLRERFGSKGTKPPRTDDPKPIPGKAGSPEALSPARRERFSVI